LTTIVNLRKKGAKARVSAEAGEVTVIEVEARARRGGPKVAPWLAEKVSACIRVKG